MSVDTYRAALVRLRDAYDLLGPYRGQCSIPDACWDARHRQADVIAGAYVAGETPEKMAADHLPEALGAIFATDIVLQVVGAVLAADPRLHGVTRGKAAGIEREAWADLARIDSTNKT